MELNESGQWNCSTYCNETDYVSIYQVPTGIIVLLSVLYGSISVIAVLGNLMVIWIVASSKTMQNVTNCFISNLALADIVIGFFAIPFEFQAALLQRWNLPDFMCAFCPFVHVLSVNVSVFTLTAIAVDRHRAILYPLSARSSKVRAKIMIAGIWLISGSIAAPMAIALGVEIVEDPPGHLKPFCNNIHLDDEVMLIYRLVLVTLQYVIPLSVITWAYARMAHALWGSKAPGNAQDTRDANLMKNKKKVIKMLVIVVALFGVCWMPLQVYNVLQDIFPQINEYKYINIIWFCFDWLAMSNSCYNPFIYNYYNEKFRREFQFRLHLCGNRVHNGFNRNQSDTDKLTRSVRMSRYYDWRTRSSKMTSVPRTPSTGMTFTTSISFTRSESKEPCNSSLLEENPLRENVF